MTAPPPSRGRRPAGGGQPPGGGVAMGERVRQDLAGRVQLRRRRDLRRRAVRGRGRGRAGGYPARRGRGRHPRPAAARRPGGPRAACPDRPQDPRRDRRADGDPPGQSRRQVSFAGTDYRAGRLGPGHASMSPSSPGRSSYPGTARSSGSTRSATTGPASSARSPTPKAAPAARTPPSAMSASYRNSHVAQVPQLDSLSDSPGRQDSLGRPTRVSREMPGFAGGNPSLPTVALGRLQPRSRPVAIRTRDDGVDRPGRSPAIRVTTRGSGTSSGTG